MTSSSESVWSKLSHHALVGSGQYPLSDELKNKLLELGISIEDEKHALLEGIALVQLLEKGAQKWLKKGVQVAQKPSFDDEKICSWQSMQHLQAILRGHHADAFPEFVFLLTQYRLSIPPENWPTLLNQCLENKNLWLLIQPILGERGVWLLQQNPAWQVLLPAQNIQSAWYELKEKELLDAFSFYRSEQPNDARESLQDQWPTLDFKLKTKLLSVFNQGLSLDDEKFLEHCLDDKRKGVRQLAAQHLALLPHSKLVQRLFTIAKEAIVFKNNALHINCPEHLPDSTLKDGIYPTGSKLQGGLKMNWLHQLVAKIPFYFWEKEWQLDAQQTIRLFTQSGYPSLVHGVTKSLLQFPNDQAINALIKVWFFSANEQFWKNNDAKALLGKASSDFFNEQNILWLEQHGPFIPADSLVGFWLSNSTHSWQKQLTKIVILGFQDLIQNHRVQKWNLFHYKNIMQKAAYQGDVECLEEFQKRWYMQLSRFGFWANDFEQLLQAFKFRQKMKAAMMH